MVEAYADDLPVTDLDFPRDVVSESDVMEGRDLDWRSATVLMITSFFFGFCLRKVVNLVKQA